MYRSFSAFFRCRLGPPSNRVRAARGALAKQKTQSMSSLGSGYGIPKKSCRSKTTTISLCFSASFRVIARLPTPSAGLGRTQAGRGHAHAHGPVLESDSKIRTRGTRAHMHKDRCLCHIRILEQWREDLNGRRVGLSGARAFTAHEPTLDPIRTTY